MSYIYNMTDTWNAGGTTFAGIKMAVTNTASSASSKLLDLSVSGATTGFFTVDKSGNASISGALTLGSSLSVANGGTGTTTSFTAGSVVFAGTSGVYSQSNSNLFWDNTNGRLGLGTTVPTDKLSVLGNSSVSTYVNNPYSYWFGFQKSRSVTPGSFSIVSNGDWIGYLRFAADDGTQFSDAAWIGGYVDGIPSTTSMPGRLIFWTTPSGSTSPVERARLDSVGNFGIGTTSISATLHAARGTDGYIFKAAGPTGTFAVSDYSSGTFLWNSNNALYLGTDTAHAFTLSTNNTSRLTISSAGNISPAAGSTSMTNGFIYMPSAGGAPSGTPTAISGTVPFYYDTTNNQFYVYNGAWKKVALT